MPLWTLIISALLLPEEHITRRKVVGLLLGFGGVVLLVSNQLSEGLGGYQLSILAMLLSAFFYGLSTVVIKLKAEGIPPEALTMGQMLMAWLAVMPMALVVEVPFHFPLEGLTWFALAWMGILSSAIGLVVYFSMLYEIGPTRVAMTTYLLPLVGVALGAIFLGEQPDWRMLAGGLMVVAGVWWVNRRTHVRAS
jgi:drug/metabolite transporter (DMT)-like permease